MYQTASNYFRNVNPQAFDLMPDMVEDNDWLWGEAVKRRLQVKKPDAPHGWKAGDELEFPVELLQERFG